MIRDGFKRLVYEREEDVKFVLTLYVVWFRLSCFTVYSCFARIPPVERSILTAWHKHSDLFVLYCRIETFSHFLPSFTRLVPCNR